MPETPEIAFVCGLKSEAQCLGGVIESRLIRISGASAERAYDCSKRLASQGARALISFGISGALTDDLIPGSLLYANEVTGPHGAEWSASESWCSAAQHASKQIELEIKAVRMVGSDRIIDTLSAKSQLQQTSRAHCVDMETHEVARVANEEKIPFFAIRAIADSSEQVIPQSALNSVAADGSVKPLAVMARLATHPSDLPALIRLGQHSAKATAALRRCALEFLPLFLRRVDFD